MTLGALKKFCRKYVANNLYVYKSCQKDWIVILQKCSNTKTNENRQDIYDYWHAPFRGSHFFVADIIHKDNLKRVGSIENSYFNGNRLTYTKGKIVYADMFDPNLNTISSNGIHYFLSIDSAYYFEMDTRKQYNGLFLDWFHNGQLRCARRYNNGINLHSIELYKWHNRLYYDYWYDKNNQKIIALTRDYYGRLICSQEINL